MGDICVDNRFEIIKRAKEDLLESTNIETSRDEMKVIDSFLFRCGQMRWLERYEKPREPLDIPTMTTDFVKEHGVPCPDGYEFKDENGNVIEAKKIVLEKKKPKYPTTFNECAEILGFKPIHGLALQLVVSSGFSISDTQICAFERNLTIRLEYFRKLLICRDAYWYCYAKENNMPFNWKPEWSSPNQEKFTIRMYDSYRHFGHDKHLHSVLAFPTAEMRDVFYGNFKELIEECKELL